MTKRSGVYGATLAEADTAVVLNIDSNGQLIQVCFKILVTIGTHPPPFES